MFLSTRSITRFIYFGGPQIGKTAANSSQYYCSARFYSSETSSATEASVDPKISGIVDSISHLNLLETSALVDALKKKLNISDVAIPVSAGIPGAALASPPIAEASSEPEPVKAKTHFTVKLEKFEASAKAKVIREIKALIPGMNLVEAKKFVESVPKTVKENIPKEDAEKMKKTLEALGATVNLE